MHRVEDRDEIADGGCQRLRGPQRSLILFRQCPCRIGESDPAYPHQQVTDLAGHRVRLGLGIGGHDPPHVRGLLPGVAGVG